jgi:serine/threonine protein phosphatase PrpC
MQPATAGIHRPAHEPMLDVEFAQLSDPGRVRGQNEDYLGYALPDSPERARSHGWLFALADGVGGQDRGEVASRAAVECLVAGFQSAAGAELLTTLMPRLVQAANARVLDTAAAAGPGSAMATTLVACALRFDRAVVAHAGDSRCYLVRRGHATLLTRDHTFANEQVRLGLLSAKEAAESPNRHILSRSLGGDLFVGVETSEHQLYGGDVLVMCSDGLHGPVEASEIATLLGYDADLEKAANKLVALANQRDGSDNISVQAIRIRGVERVGMYRGRPYRLR